MAEKEFLAEGHVKPWDHDPSKHPGREAGYSQGDSVKHLGTKYKVHGFHPSGDLILKSDELDHSRTERVHPSQLEEGIIVSIKRGYVMTEKELSRHFGQILAETIANLDEATKWAEKNDADVHGTRNLKEDEYDDQLSKNDWTSKGHTGFNAQRFTNKEHPGHRIDVAPNFTWEHSKVSSKGQTGSIPGVKLGSGEDHTSLGKHLDKFHGKSINEAEINEGGPGSGRTAANRSNKYIHHSGQAEMLSGLAKDAAKLAAKSNSGTDHRAAEKAHSKAAQAHGLAFKYAPTGTDGMLHIDRSASHKRKQDMHHDKSWMPRS